jgi:cold-inducible RNA-binding protein
MSSNLYVGNLSFNVVEKDLEDLFSTYGEVVSANVITDRQTGRPRGFGFVEMKSPEDAQKAIESLDGKEFMGRNLTVNIAKPRNEGGGGRGGSGGGGGRDRGNRGRGPRW